MSALYVIRLGSTLAICMLPARGGGREREMARRSDRAAAAGDAEGGRAARCVPEARASAGAARRTAS